MTKTQETHAQRKEREARSILREIIEAAGGIVNVRFDRGGSRLAVRFDTIDDASAVRLFIAYRTAQQSDADALKSAAHAILLSGLSQSRFERID